MNTPNQEDAIARDTMETDVLIVGAGPAGLSAAIRLKQLAALQGREISVTVLEKAAEVGAHILSGAVFDPKALTELIPDWQDRGAPIHQKVSGDEVLWLCDDGGVAKIPNMLLPQTMRNEGCYIIRLGHLVKWLGEQAESLGVDIFPGFAGASLILENHQAVGIITGDMGINRDGTRGPHFQPGMAIRAKYTLLSEGCRGHLGKQAEKIFNLRHSEQAPSYGLGIKELWEIPEGKPSTEHFVAGKVVHTVGYPMDNATYGGGFAYFLHEPGAPKLIALGFVTGLGYSNPYLSPYEEFQRYKQHPSIRRLIEGGKRLSYGARAIAAGGLPSLPTFVFPGGALLGDDAGFLNPARIKGSHAAIASGKMCAEAVAENLFADTLDQALDGFTARFNHSWLKSELHTSRNFKPYFKHGLIAGALLFGIDQKIFGGAVPWTLKNSPDHTKLKKKSECAPINYPKPDGVISFDRLSSVFLSNTNHEENQPIHLQLTTPSVAIDINLRDYDAPEQRYCPAGVYEIVTESGAPRLQINAQNCVHCKTCDIKDPTQNINWVTPQGGEGPIYQGM